MSEKRAFSTEYFLETKMNDKLKNDPDVMDGFDCVYQFEIEGRTWHLDLLSSSERQIKKGAHSEPDCTVVISDENFEKLVKGKLNAPLALLSGKLKIKGEKALALKLAKLFS